MSRNFDGVDDLIDCGSGAHLDDLANWTWCAWIYPETQGEGTIGRIMNKAPKNFRIGGSTNLNATSSRAGTTMNLISAANSLTLNAWQFVAWTYDGTNGRLLRGVPGGVVSEMAYDAGSAQGSGAFDTDAAGVLVLGNDITGAATFDGPIANARVFNAALSANELTALMYGRPVRGASLRGWWPLIGASPEPDWSGNVANGTVTGALVDRNPPIPAPFSGIDGIMAWAGGGGGGGSAIIPVLLSDYM